MKSSLIYPAYPPTGFLPSKAEGYFHAIEYLCRRMRPDEIEQHMLLNGYDPDVDEFDPRRAAIGIINSGGLAFFMVDKENVPYAAGGFAEDPTMSRVWQAWGIGTPEAWGAHWRDITRAVRWTMGQLLSGGARRLEINIRAKRTKTVDWYTNFLGLKLDGVRREYLLHGEDLLTLSITESDFITQQEGRESPLSEAA